MKKRIITLIAKEQAINGMIIKLYSIPDICRTCKLYDTCLGKLKPGRTYRIVEVRRINLPGTHRCLLTGEVLTPVVVEEEPIVIALPESTGIIEGVILTYHKVNIDKKCLSKYLYRIYNLNDGVKIRIVRILDRIICEGKKYIIVEAIPLD